MMQRHIGKSFREIGKSYVSGKLYLCARNKYNDNIYTFLKYIGRALAYVSLLLASASCGNGDGEIFNGEIKAARTRA